MKCKKLFIFLAALIAVAAVGTPLAFMLKKTLVDNRFVPGSVSCQLYETVDGTEYIGVGARHGSTESGIKVENTGNISAFIRVRLFSYWTDADGNTVGLPSELPAIDFGAANWLKGENNAYY